MDLLNELRKNPFVLAPMAGITDSAFRSFMRRQGAGVVVTELVSANGIEHNSRRTQSLAAFTQDQHPLGVQLFGEDPSCMATAARWAEQLGADFVDVNLGCPVPKVVQKGAGSALLKDLPALRRVLEAMKQALTIPLTIKIRTGWDQNTRNAIEVARLAEDVGVAWVAIHGRTRAQAYTGLADWDYIGNVKASVKVPILGNGDINFPSQAVERLRTYGVDGVLIGRGCLKNPLIFRQALAQWKAQQQMNVDNLTLWDVYQDLRTELVEQCEERILQIQLKKFAAWYSSGYSGSAHFRKTIFQLEKTDEILAVAQQFLSDRRISDQMDTSSEAFLMGGHG